MKIKKNKFECS